MVARKRLSYDNFSAHDNNLRNGYNCIRDKAHGYHKTCNTYDENDEFMFDTFSECVSTIEREEDQHLIARSSKARTSLSVATSGPKNLHDHSSTQTKTSWVINNNMTRLKTAYRFLTPIIDDIISCATSFSHRQFKEILHKRQPICTISYTQYIRAYQASAIISQVGKDLSSVQVNLPYQVDFIVNNVPTIKKEDLLENIERMADRIFIDRDLMKQLVNLHELITDTIKKLKLNLDQVSIDGIHPESIISIKKSQFDVDFEHDITVDRDAIRKQIAEHFIVIGEPKTKVCDCFDDPPPPPADQDSHTSREQATVRLDIPVDHRNSIAMNAQVDDPVKPLQNKTVKKRWSRKGKSKQDVDQQSQQQSIAGNNISLLGATSVDQSEVKEEISHLVNKDTPYTVSAQEYRPKCFEGAARACATVDDSNEEMAPPDLVEDEITEIDEDVLIVAESQSNDLDLDTHGQAGPQPYEPMVPVPPEIYSRPTIKGSLKCKEFCNADPDLPCSDVSDFLRDLMGKIAAQLRILKENELIDFEDKQFDRCGFEGVEDEYRCMQEVMYCLNTLEKVKTKLISINFAEIDAEMPDKNLGCCYRETPHVHAGIIGIPIIIKISQTLLNVLKNGYPYASNRLATTVIDSNGKGVEDVDTIVKPNTKNKKCECKPVTLKSLIKERCALAKMISSRNSAPNKNKVVMMTVDPLVDNIFGMTANSLLVESAFQERDPDIFQVMDMADSNSSLPYVVNRSSLPNVTICPPMNIEIQELRKMATNVNIEHPKLRIRRELQNIGFDNLLKASLPAKCCKPIAINGPENEDEPFHASLNSLPLTTSDLRLIMDVAEEETYNAAICKYHPSNYYFSATIRLKFERYTNFQEFRACKYDHIVPITRVYLVYYFAMFKKSEEHEAVTNYSSDRHRGNRQNRAHHRREHSRYETQDRHSRYPNRSVLSEFFRRYIFAVPNYDECVQDSCSKEDDEKRRRRKHSKRRVSSRQSAQILPSSSASSKRMQSKKLQSSDQDNYDDYDELIVHERKDYVTSKDAQLDKISSSMKNYTITSMSNSKEDPRSRASLQNSSTSKLKASAAHITLSKPSRQAEIYSSKRGVVCRPAASKELIEIKPKLSQDLQSKADVHREPKFDKALKDVSNSANNLGTIYENDEQITHKDEVEPASAHSSFLDVFRTEELSESFQRFIESEKIVELIENSPIDPEEFWRRYFIHRRATHQSLSKTASIVLISDSEPSNHDELPVSSSAELPEKPRKRMRSRIPKPIRKSIKETVNNVKTPSVRKENLTDAPPPEAIAPKLSVIQCAKSNLSCMSQMDCHRHIRPHHAHCGDNYDRPNESDSSMHSLRVLANKNGPGYIAVLHPACGCPEVSIYIPCYCNEKGPKRAGLTAKQIARLSANTNGRHILLPATCRIPQLKPGSRDNRDSLFNNCRTSRY